MNDQGWLAEQFDGHRAHLRAVAYRMLGSVTEADDAVQDAWIKVSRAEAGAVQNLGGWFTTIVSRVCLDTLRARAAKREAPLEAFVPDPLVHAPGTPDAERDLVVAESVGLALLVVLETLAPAERLAGCGKRALDGQDLLSMAGFGDQATA